MWVVRAGDGRYVRSAYGPGNPWYQRARAAAEGRVRAGGIEPDIIASQSGHRLGVLTAGQDAALATLRAALLAMASQL